MKTKRWLGIIFTLLVAGLMTVGVIEAQSAVTVNPSQVTVAGSRGNVETRILLLQSSETITSLQVITLDLPSTDGTTVLPASAIKTAVSADTLTANEIITLSVTVDMGNTASGEFQGNLFINYTNGQLTVPLTVKVKDTWYLPLLILVFGIGLAAGISYYRTKGKPRDEVLVRAGQIQAQMKKDTELAEPFRAAIDTAVVDVETALQTQKWEEAQTAVGKAETYWHRWRRHRRDWLAQRAYYDELLTQFEQADPQNNISYIQAIKHGVIDIERTTAEMETPELFRQKLEGASQQLNRYRILASQIDAVGQKAGDLEQDEAAKWKNQAISWQKQLDQLNPTDETAYQNLANLVAEGVNQLHEAGPGVTNRAMPGDGAKGLISAQLSTLNLLGATPTLIDTADEEQVTTANRNLRIFALVSYVVAIGLLAGAGFAELYVAQPTFGANPWQDYLALLIWGFGVEASRSAVVDMIRGWGIQ